MKSYYDAHETAYQDLKRKGHVGWGNKKTLAELEDQDTCEFLQRLADKYYASHNGATALDLGCGSGTTAFTLAKLGFTVTGVDVSPTAIEMAKDLSQKQSLTVQFEVTDILNLSSLNRRFDLIYDSHFFHCVVFTEDRQKVLSEVQRCLQPNGRFVIDTMVATEGFDPQASFDTLRFDQDYILWHKTSDENVRGVTLVNDQLWCAQRRIYPAPTVVNEMHEAGFQIISEELFKQEEGEPSMLRLVLTRELARP